MDRERFARAAEQWLLHLRDERRLATTSVRTFRSSLQCLVGLLPDEYSAEDLRRALDVRLGRGASAYVRRSSYDALMPFFDWWEERGGIENPLADMVPPPKPSGRRREFDDDEEMDLLRRLAAAAPKDRAMVWLLLVAGFRVSDVVSLRVEDIDFRGKQLRAAWGKDGTDVWLPLAQPAALALRAWLDLTRLEAGYVFTGPTGQMWPQSVWKAFRRVCGPDLAHLKPHQARHTFATGLIHHDGVALPVVQDLMRHRSIASTMIYVHHSPRAQRAAILQLGERYKEQMEPTGKKRKP